MMVSHELFALVSLDCARHVSLVQKTTRYAGGK